jgi:sulfate permease, SulP family
MTVIVAAALVTFPGDMQAILAVAFMAGILQIIAGFIKIGTFVRYIPYPVISGFMSGIGVIIILIQLHPLLGAPGVSSPLEALINLPNQSLILISIAFLLPS